MARNDEFKKLASKLYNTIRVNRNGLEGYLRDNKDKVVNAVTDTVKMSFKTDEDGNLINDEYNQEASVSLRTKIRNALKATGIDSKLNDFIQGFEKVEQVNTQIAEEFYDANNAKIDNVFLSLQGFKKRVFNKLVDGFFGLWLDANLVSFITDTLDRKIAGGARFSDTVSEIRNVIIGNGSDPKLITHYIQISRDAIGQYNGMIQQEFTKTFDLNAFIYVGAELEDTRKTCIDLLEQPFWLIEDIPKIIEKYENNPGWIKGTDITTFFANRGGYNCIHECVAYYATPEEIKALKNEKS